MLQLKEMNWCYMQPILQISIDSIKEQKEKIVRFPRSGFLYMYPTVPSDATRQSPTYPPRSNSGNKNGTLQSGNGLEQLTNKQELLRNFQ